MGKTRIHNVHAGEVWTAYYPFKEGFAKKRPVLIVGFEDASHVIVQRISRKRKYGARAILAPASLVGSYLHDEMATIEILSFRSLIWKRSMKERFILSDEKIPYPDWWEDQEHGKTS